MFNFQKIFYIIVFFISNNAFSESIVFEEDTLDANTPKITIDSNLDIPFINYTSSTESLNYKIFLTYDHQGTCEVIEGGATEEDCKGNIKYNLYWRLTHISPIKDEITEGKKLYNNACLLCHQYGGSSSLASTEPNAIRARIITNTGQMGSLSYLSDAQLSSISEYLKTLSTYTTVSTDAEKGKSIYDSKCLACHALGTSSSNASAVSSLIASAINNNIAGMGVLSYLSDTDLENIAKYIQSLLVIE